ncbi:pentapeptide repeat-containing protein [Psychrobacter sp. HD31]
MVDLQRYKVDVERTAEERKAIQQEHLERIEQGNEIWNAWATEVEKELEKRYLRNATTERKRKIRNQYQIDLSEMVFVQSVSFMGFNFPLEVNFQLARFESTANFVSTTFESKANFQLARFKSQANFGSSTFESEANFVSTTFESEAVFFSATFKLSAFYLRTKFNKQANFFGAKFDGEKPQTVLFLGARFENSALFNDMEFSKNAVLPVDFRQTHFNNIPLVESLPSDVVILQKKAKQFGVTDFSKYESQFRTLKRLAEANNNHQKALEFYACELYCQRQANNGLKNIKNWAGFLYGLSSNYGLSLLRPFCFWLAIMCGGAIGQAWVDNKITFTQPYSFNAERAAFYAAPSLPPFIQNAHYQKEVRQRLYPANNNNKVDAKGKLPMPIRIIRGVQTFFTFIAIFLFGLALRNRFKIK